MGQEADQIRAALRYAEALYLRTKDPQEREVVRGRMVELADWIAAHDRQNDGPALGMPGVSWDAFKSRQDIEPLRVAMPESLPGGKWGATPQPFAVQTDGAGQFLAGLGPRSLIAAPGAELLRAEWAIPTLWNVQIQLAVTGLTVPWPVGWTVNVLVTGSVDNAECGQLIALANGPGCYPFQGANALALLGTTYQLVAQQVRVRLQGFTGAPGPLNVDAVLTVQAVAGLASASLPATR